MFELCRVYAYVASNLTNGAEIKTSTLTGVR